MTPRRPVVLAALAMTLGGCSMVFVRPVPPGRIHHETSGGCTESKAPPVIDSVVTALEVLQTGYDLVAPNSAYQGARLSRGPSVAVGALLIAGFAGSAAYGFKETDNCWQVRERERFEAPLARGRLTRQPSQPRDLVPPPMPPPYVPPRTAAATDGGAEDAQPAAPDASDLSAVPRPPAARAVPQQPDTE